MRKKNRNERKKNNHPPHTNRPQKALKKGLPDYKHPKDSTSKTLTLSQSLHHILFYVSLLFIVIFIPWLPLRYPLSSTSHFYCHPASHTFPVSPLNHLPDRCCLTVLFSTVKLISILSPPDATYSLSTSTDRSEPVTEPGPRPREGRKSISPRALPHRLGSLTILIFSK